MAVWSDELEFCSQKDQNSSYTKFGEKLVVRSPKDSKNCTDANRKINILVSVKEKFGIHIKHQLAKCPTSIFSLPYAILDPGNIHVGCSVASDGFRYTIDKTYTGVKGSLPLSWKETNDKSFTLTMSGMKTLLWHMCA